MALVVPSEEALIAPSTGDRDLLNRRVPGNPDTCRPKRKLFKGFSPFFDIAYERSHTKRPFKP
jgi:hypothetical protein